MKSCRLRHRRRHGTTLIEVAAGLVILGTVVCMVVVMRGRFLRQWAIAQRKEQAIAAADALMSDWWARPDALPRHDQGDVADTMLVWRTRVMPNPQADRMNAQVVRLEIFDARNGKPTMRTSTHAPVSLPLAVLDVLVNKPTQSNGTLASPEHQ